MKQYIVTLLMAVAVITVNTKANTVISGDKEKGSGFLKDAYQGNLEAEKFRSVWKGLMRNDQQTITEYWKHLPNFSPADTREAYRQLIGKTIDRNVSFEEAEKLIDEVQFVTVSSTFWDNYVSAYIVPGGVGQNAMSFWDPRSTTNQRRKENINRSVIGVLRGTAIVDTWCGNYLIRNGQPEKKVVYDDYTDTRETKERVEVRTVVQKEQCCDENKFVYFELGQKNAELLLMRGIDKGAELTRNSSSAQATANAGLGLMTAGRVVTQPVYLDAASYAPPPPTNSQQQIPFGQTWFGNFTATTAANVVGEGLNRLIYGRGSTNCGNCGRNNCGGFCGGGGYYYNTTYSTSQPVRQYNTSTLNPIPAGLYSAGGALTPGQLLQ